MPFRCCYFGCRLCFLELVNLVFRGQRCDYLNIAFLSSYVVSSKQPKLGLMQELSFSRISESTTRYTFTPCVGSFTIPGIDTRQKGPLAFSLFRKIQANVG